jgi:hypothetical protein
MRKFKRRVIPDPEPEVDLDELEGLIEDEDEDEDEDEEDDEYDEYEDDDDDDEDEDEDDDDDEPLSLRRPRRPSFRPSRRFDFDDGDEEELSEEMAAAIRAGEYKPRRSDPWSAHVLYNALKDIGKL